MPVSQLYCASAPSNLLGAEAGYSWLTGNNGSIIFPAGTVVTGSSNQLGSVTGRLGYTWGPALLYAKGGFAWRDNNNIGVTTGGTPASFTTSGNQKDGYTVGAGLEYMFAPNWSAKAEYQYYNFGSTSFTSGPADVVGARFRDDEQTVKLGLNYRFGVGRSGRAAVLSVTDLIAVVRKGRPRPALSCEMRACENNFCSARNFHA